MSDRRYYINSGEYWTDMYENGKRNRIKKWRGLQIKYSKCIQKKVSKRVLFFNYEKTEPVYITYTKNVPLFLYRDGEMFFELFTKRYFGREVTSHMGLSFHGKGVYVPNALVETAKYIREEYGNDSIWPTVTEYSPSEFLRTVNEIKEELASLGVTEQDLIDQINEIFDEHERKTREKAAAEEEKRQKEAKAAQERERQNELAKKELDNLLR